jgi:phosphomevalonate kinase
VIARAPGKAVLSGAYSVLAGAPALVAAVDRYVIADGSRPAELVTDEVRAAIEAHAIERAPWFDAAALRAIAPDGTSRKLGLGSSAAILVASLAAVWPSELAADALRSAIFPVALAAHRRAQGGGSGLDVAASVFGGVLECRLEPGSGALSIAPHALPSGLHLALFASPTSTPTRDLLARVRALGCREPQTHDALLDRARRGAERAATTRDAAAWLRALDEQFDALDALGRAALAPIVDVNLGVLRRVASAEGATLGPSGAGGGDVALFASHAEPSAHFLAEAQSRGLERLDVHFGATGVARG